MIRAQGGDSYCCAPTRRRPLSCMCSSVLETSPGRRAETHICTTVYIACFLAKAGYPQLYSPLSRGDMSGWGGGEQNPALHKMALYHQLGENLKYLVEVAATFRGQNYLNLEWPQISCGENPVKKLYDRNRPLTSVA